jgi:hypothetical protein
MRTPAHRGGRKAAAGADVPLHFVIRLGGVSFAYCYIRKNACSAWRRLVIHESPVPYRSSEWKSEMAFMLAHQRLRTIEEIDRCDHRVVVVRDPVDRFVSGFVSLLVTRTPPATRRLRRLSEKAFGRDVFDLSFDQLLESQLPHRTSRRDGLDRHFWPQVWHLAQTRYTDVLDIDRLGVDMRRLIGEELGARYFDKAVNSTSTATTFDDPEAPSLSARSLVERFRATGCLPSKASFIAGGRGDEIRAAYDEDSSLFEACRAHYRAEPGISMEFEVAGASGSEQQRKKRKRSAGVSRRRRTPKTERG